MHHDNEDKTGTGCAGFCIADRLFAAGTIDGTKKKCCKKYKDGKRCKSCPKR